MRKLSILSVYSLSSTYPESPYYARYWVTICSFFSCNDQHGKRKYDDDEEEDAPPNSDEDEDIPNYEQKDSDNNGKVVYFWMELHPQVTSQRNDRNEKFDAVGAEWLSGPYTYTTTPCGW